MKIHRASFSLASIALVVAVLAAGCTGDLIRGSGNVVTETREVGSFERVSVCCGMNLILTQGTQPALQIEAEDNLLPEIRSVVSGDTLVIEFERTGPARNYETTQPIRCYVTVNTLSGLSVSNGGRLEAENLVADVLEVELSGGSTGSIDSLEATSLDLTINDGGSAVIAGNIDHQDVRLSGGSDYTAEDLQSLTANVEISDGGEATVWVTEDLSATLNSGSQLGYYGSPQISSQNLSGGSEIETLGER